MKKFVNTKTLPLVTVVGALLGIGLRLWTIGGGPDAEGLYASKPLVWGLLWALTIGLGMVIWLTVKNLKTSPNYRDNYPASVVAGVCTLPLAVVWLIDSISTLKSAVVMIQINGVSMVCGLVGLAAAVCLVVRGVCYAMGKKPSFAVDGVICIAFAVRLFSCCQQWSNIPQMSKIAVPFLATLVLMLAAYYRVGFDVDMGNRAVTALWSLMSVYLCLVAVFSFEQPGFYAACALWQMGTLCNLRPMKRKKPQQPPEQDQTEPEV